MAPVNDGSLTGVHFEAFADSSTMLEDPRRLRARLDADGYLYIRGLIPPSAIQDVRRRVLHRLDEFGWLDRDAALNDGVIDQAAIDRIPSEELRSDIGISHSGYLGVQQLRDVHALPHHHRLITLFEHLLDGTVFVHPRHIVRVMTSHRDLHPTPPHQDFPLIQGTERTLTCWIPLGDCSFDLGPLTICEGSHAGGYRPVVEASGAGGITVQRCDDEIATETWRRGEFLAGDVLIFTVDDGASSPPGTATRSGPPLDGHPLPGTHRTDRVAVARKPPRTPMGRRVRELGRERPAALLLARRRTTALGLGRRTPPTVSANLLTSSERRLDATTDGNKQHQRSRSPSWGLGRHGQQRPQPPPPGRRAETRSCSSGDQRARLRTQ